MGARDLRREIDELDPGRFLERHPSPFLLGDNTRTTITRRLMAVDSDAAPEDGEEGESLEIHEVVRRDGEKGDVVLGSATEADVVIAGLARRHGVLTVTPDGWGIAALDPGEGPIAVRGALVGREERTPLRSGDTIAFLGGELRYVFLDAKDLHARLRRSQAPAPLPVAPLAAVSAGPEPSVVLVARCAPFDEVVLPPDREVKIGRAPECGLVLPHSSVSRIHAALVRRGDSVFVRDLGSVNGTLLGSRRIDGEKEVKPDGPPVVVGVYRILIARAEDADGSAEATAAFKREDLSCTIDAMPLGDFVQGIERNELTGRLRIETAEGATGVITFVRGAPHTAAFGSARGAPAIFELLRVRHGTLHLEKNAEPEGPSEIRGTFTGILLEASRLEDEADRSRLAARIAAATEAARGVYSGIGMAKYGSPEQFLLSLEKGSRVDASDPAVARIRESLQLLCRRGEKGSEGRIVRALVIAAYALRGENIAIGAFEIVRSLAPVVEELPDGSADVVGVVERLLGAVLKKRAAPSDLDALARAACPRGSSET